MRVEPEILYYDGKTPVYKCSCGHVFKRIELLFNKRIKGEFNYCPQCKNKFNFKEK